MDPRWRHPHGLRPTIRQLMILVVYGALVSAIAATILRDDSGPPAYLAISVLVPLSPLVLALLVLIFDRGGPAKAWLVSLLAHLTFPTFMAWVVGMMMVAGPTVPTYLLLLPATLGTFSLVRATRRFPRRCPECGVARIASTEAAPLVCLVRIHRAALMRKAGRSKLGRGGVPDSATATIRNQSRRQAGHISPSTASQDRHHRGADDDQGES